MKTYGCIGEVRGDCGHKHRTLSGAVSCLKRDREGCGSQGGYSDREIVIRRPGPGGFDYDPLGASEWEAVYGDYGMLG
jgi:hypothetical protein